MPPRGGRNFNHHTRSPPPPPPREREDRYSNHHIPRSGASYPSNRRQEHHTRGTPPPSHREQGRVLTHTGNRLNPRRRHSGEYPRDRGGHPNHSKGSLSSSLHEGYVVDRYVPKPSRNERQHPSSHPRSGHSPRYHQRPPSREQMHSSRDHFSAKGHYSPVNSYSHPPPPPPSLSSHNRSRENDMHYRDQRSHIRHHNHREHQNRPHTHSSSTMRSKHQYRSKDVRSLPKQTMNRRSRDPAFEEQRGAHRQRHDETEIHLSPDTHHRSRSPFDSPPQDTENNVDLSPQEPKEYLDDEPQYQTRTPSPSVEVEEMDKEREGTPYEAKDYSHLRHSNTPPTNFIEGNVAEFATNEAFSDEAFNEQPYANVSNTEYDYFHQQEPENYQTESQFLEIDEVKDESREEEYLEPVEPVTSAPYYQEREVVYSPPHLEREVIHVKNEREVIVSRSPSNRQSRSRSGTPTLMD